MKMYTNSDQTDKLIELGFERPKGWCVEGISSRLIMYKHKEDDEDFNYAIGELIEMLPDVVESEDSEYATLQMYFDLFNWVIEYTGVEKTEYATSAIELIDSLYDMILRLKDEGVI